MPQSITSSAHLVTRSASAILSSDKTDKVGVFIKLDKEVVEWFKNSGPGYQRKINEVLRRFVSAVKSNEAGSRESSSVLERAQELFEKYYEQCFWHMKRELIVTEVDLPQIIKGLKTYGGRAGYLEASKLSL